MFPQEWGAEISPLGMGPSVLPKNGNMDSTPGMSLRKYAGIIPSRALAAMLPKNGEQESCSPRNIEQELGSPGTGSRSGG